MRRMTRTKGQVTVFIVLCILVVLFLVLSGLQRNTLSMPRSEEDISSFISSCLQDSALKAVEVVAASGGSDTSVIPLPPAPLQDVESRISAKTERLLSSCYDSFSRFPQFKVSAGQPKVSSIISGEGVNVELTQSFKVVESGRERVIDRSAAFVRTDVLDAIHQSEAFRDGQDILPILATGLNATVLSKGDIGFIVFDFSMAGDPSPVRWWSRLPVPLVNAS